MKKLINFSTSKITSEYMFYIAILINVLYISLLILSILSDSNLINISEQTNNVLDILEISYEESKHDIILENKTNNSFCKFISLFDINSKYTPLPKELANSFYVDSSTTINISEQPSTINNTYNNLLLLSKNRGYLTLVDDLFEILDEMGNINKGLSSSIEK
jgi:hypothetical protein